MKDPKSVNALVQVLDETGDEDPKPSDSHTILKIRHLKSIVPDGITTDPCG